MATKTPVVFPQNTCLGEYITEEVGFPYPSGGDPDHVAVLPNDNEILRPTSHVGKLIERLVEVYDNREEAARRAEVAYNMVHNNLVWDKHINPQWISLFDKVVASEGGGVPQAGEGGKILQGDLL
jgi:hypothetical protein